MRKRAPLIIPIFGPQLKKESLGIPRALDPFVGHIRGLPCGVGTAAQGGSAMIISVELFSQIEVLNQKGDKRTASNFWAFFSVEIFDITTPTALATIMPYQYTDIKVEVKGQIGIIKVKKSHFIEFYRSIALT